MKIGKKYLISCDAFFMTPDGDSYQAVFGTVHGVQDAEQVLGIKTNSRSTNWYVVIGDMIIAGCQIHYAMRADSYNPEPSRHAEIDHGGVRHQSSNALTRIYNADASGLIPTI
ncbi:hypothetical protein [Ketogulonicigenium vulgare]|uniref:hypothetical protein n=1 Tax=Ketogulonicigenium vulgare TaxID=92945 RepID=UPI00235847B9|nr:hypothetical protein [Ketogulonicigenium vulgare]